MDLKDLYKGIGFKEVQHASALEVEEGNPLSPLYILVKGVYTRSCTPPRNSS